MGQCHFAHVEVAENLGSNSRSSGVPAKTVGVKGSAGRVQFAVAGIASRKNQDRFTWVYDESSGVFALGVFDGHGTTAAAADKCKEELVQRILSEVPRSASFPTVADERLLCAEDFIDRDITSPESSARMSGSGEPCHKTKWETHQAGTRKTLLEGSMLFVKQGYVTVTLERSKIPQDTAALSGCKASTPAIEPEDLPLATIDLLPGESFFADGPSFTVLCCSRAKLLEIPAKHAASHIIAVGSRTTSPGAGGTKDRESTPRLAPKVGEIRSPHPLPEVRSPPRPRFPSDQAISRGFFNLDKDICAEHAGSRTGTTATLLFLQPNGEDPESWNAKCACVGDSRCIRIPLPAVHGHSALPIMAMSADHRLDNDEERARLEACIAEDLRVHQKAQTEISHRVSTKSDCRVEAVFSPRSGVSTLMTRSIGDPLAAPSLIPVPDIHHIPNSPSGSRFVAASDGLWDVASPSEVARKISSIRDPETAAKKLARFARKTAFNKGIRQDDVTVAVIDINRKSDTVV